MSTTNRPKLAVNTFVWYSPLTDQTLAELIPRLAGWGYDAVELAVEDPDRLDFAAAAVLLEKHGITPVIGAVLPPGRELVAAPAETVRATQRYLQRCVDAAATIGANRVIGPMYAGVGRTWRLEPPEHAALLTELREALRPVADYAGQHGVCLGLEPLNRYETSVLNTVAQAWDVIDGLPAEAIGLAPDVYHMNIEEKNIPAALRSAGPRLVHLQVCANDRGTPGEDSLDWNGIRQALVDVAFKGIVGIESFTPDNEVIATAASIWRPLAESPDRLAVDGLHFLRTWTADWPG
jgi:D-psicose/D-tagatose/L-ribulose 3-epimerase